VGNDTRTARILRKRGEGITLTRSEKKNIKRNRVCELCGKKGGGMRTLKGGSFAHSNCAKPRKKNKKEINALRDRKIREALGPSRREKLQIDRKLPISPTLQRLEIYAEKMRNEPTPAEAEFHARLLTFCHEKQLTLVAQQPFFSWIFDFHIKELSVLIEVDGGYHLTAEQRKKDQAKTADAESRGFTVVRLWNSEVATFNLNILIKSKSHSKAQAHLDKWLNKNKIRGNRGIKHCITPVSEQKVRLIKAYVT
jgi:very-short-patch-repair endonuclease